MSASHRSGQLSIPALLLSVVVLCTIAAILASGFSKGDPHTTGADGVTPSATQACEIVVVNDSEVSIYPMLTTGALRDDLGVVGTGAEKCEGFVPFRLGDEVVIIWRRGSLQAPAQTARLATKPFIARRSQIKSLHFIYHTNHEWTVKAFDGAGIDRREVVP